MALKFPWGSRTRDRKQSAAVSSTLKVKVMTLKNILVIVLIMLVTKDVEAGVETGTAPQSSEWFRKLIVDKAKNLETEGKYF